MSYTPAGLRAYFDPNDTEDDHGEIRKMLVWAADEIERLDSQRADAQLASDTQARYIEELRGYNKGLAQELSWEKGINRNLLVEHQQLSDKLRIAEAVRDDARAASQRCLDEKRALMQAPAMYVRMASDRLEAVAKSELRILANFAAQEIKERDDKLVAIATVLQGDRDDASAMIEAVRKIVGEKRVHMECVNMPSGTGPCACLDGCGSCDSCGHWLGDPAEDPQSPKSVTYKGMVVPPGYSATFRESDGSVTTICATGPSSGSSSSPSGYRASPAWNRPGASSTEIRDSIIAAVGMMADARTPEMQAAYDAALAREGKIDSPDGPVRPPGSGGNERGIDGAFPPLDQKVKMQQDAAEKRRLLETGKIFADTGVANTPARIWRHTPILSDRVEGWKKGVLESIDKLTAFQMNGNSLTYEKALELLNTLYHHPPTFSTTVITREQLVQDKVYETWVPSAADGAIIGEPLAMRLPVVDPSRAPEVIEKPRAEGDHYFEDWCNACGAGQPSGECSVCPHLPVGYGPGGYGAIDTNAEHYARRPCQSCGSTDLRSVRVREPTK